MRINLNNALCFQKKLIATCNIIKNGSNQSANIYELDKIKDEKIYKKAMKQPEWENSFYLDILHYDFLFEQNTHAHYVLEDKTTKQPLCFAMISCEAKQNNLETIETAPNFSSYNNEKRQYKYIGETMITFLVNLTKKQNKKIFYIPHIAQREKTKEFYFKQCNFDTATGEEAWLDKRKFDSMLEKNYKHTHSNINFIV